MRPTPRLAFAAASLTVLAASASAAQPGTSADDGSVMLYAVGGTGGIGGGIGYHFGDLLTVRGELAGYTYSDTTDKDGVSYHGDLKLSTKALYLDVHPFSGTFRITVGIDSGRTKFGGTAVGNGGTIDINGTSYAYGPADWVNAEVRYPSTMPYVGLGWGLAGRGLNVGFDLGVNVGHADLAMARSASLGAIPGFDADFNAQRDKYAADVKDVKVFPIVKLSVGYSF